MSIAINVPTGIPNFSQRVTLDGSEYVLDFDWNDRESRWYFELSDSSANPIVRRTKIVANWPLLKGVADSRCPPGILMALDLSGAGADPLYDEWGERVLLVYFEASEL